MAEVWVTKRTIVGSTETITEVTINDISEETAIAFASQVVQTECESIECFLPRVESPGGSE